MCGESLVFCPKDKPLPLYHQVILLTVSPSLFFCLWCKCLCSVLLSLLFSMLNIFHVSVLFFFTQEASLFISIHLNNVSFSISLQNARVGQDGVSIYIIFHAKHCLFYRGPVFFHSTIKVQAAQRHLSRSIWTKITMILWVLRRGVGLVLSPPTATFTDKTHVKITTSDHLRITCRHLLTFTSP